MFRWVAYRYLAAALLVGCANTGAPASVAMDAEASEPAVDASSEPAADAPPAAPDIPPEAVDAAEEAASPCGQSCLKEECPTGFECVSVWVPSGLFPFCVPEEDACECFDSEIDESAGAWCERSNVHGTCKRSIGCDPATGRVVCGPGEPGPELCDDIDNDCDGSTDELFDSVGAPCDGGLGQCAVPGELACTQDRNAVECVGFAPIECGDDLFCTIDDCDPATGCVYTVVPGACAIDGECTVQGTVHPSDPCQRCVPSANPDGWTVVATPGIVDLCGDSIDNDCDGIVDGDDCVPVLESAGGARLWFESTEGIVTNLVDDHGNDTYSTALVGLSDPDAQGLLTALAEPEVSAEQSFEITGGAAAELHAISQRDHLFIDAPNARIVARLRDGLGRPAEPGTLVTASFGIEAISEQTSCATGEYGRCSIEWTAPDEAFETSGTVSWVVTAPGVGSLQGSIDLTAAPAPLVLSEAGGGAELPLSPVFPQDQFVVPIRLHTGGIEAGSYDIHVSFDPEVVQPIAFEPGTCPAFGVPVSNVGETANALGVLKFNAINQEQGHPCATGDDVHVVDILFHALAVDGPTIVDGPISAVLVDLFSVNLIPIAQDTPLLIRDHSAGISTDGEVLVWARSLRGIMTRLDDHALLDGGSLDGISGSTQLRIDAWFRDYSKTEVTDETDAEFATDAPAVATVSDSGQVGAGGSSGAATLQATWGGETDDVRVRVLRPSTVALDIADTTLQTIESAGLLQWTTARAIAAWSDGGEVTFESDVTDRVQIQPAAGLVWDPLRRTLTPLAPGKFAVSLQGAQLSLGSAVVDVDALSTVTVTGLELAAPCRLQITGLAPPPAVDVESIVTASALPLAQVGDTCALQVTARFSDGRVAPLYDEVVLSSLDPAIATTVGPFATALAAGKAAIRAVWISEEQTLGAAQRTITVETP